jgi:large subunit ribosomal protein L25
MKVVAVNGDVRTSVGKKETKAVRNENKIPCVLYGGKEIIHFTVTVNDVRDLVYTPDFNIAEITLDGQSHKAILKDVQFHPVTDEIRHMDFLRLIDGHSIKVELPLRFKGVSPGVKGGGKLQQNLRRVRVKTTPEKIVGELVLDISSLKLGDSIRVRDIEAIEGIEIMNAPGTPIATVETPRALRSAASAAEKAATVE